MFESVSISNYQLTLTLFIHGILCRQDDCSNFIFFFLSFFCIDKDTNLTSKNMRFIVNRCGTWVIVAILIIIYIMKCVKIFFSVVENSGAAHSYLIYWSVYVDLTSGKASLCPPQIVKESTVESRIIRGVGIIEGGLDIVIIINNKGDWNNRGVGRGWKNSVGGFLVLIC